MVNRLPTRGVEVRGNKANPWPYDHPLFQSKSNCKVCYEYVFTDIESRTNYHKHRKNGSNGLIWRLPWEEIHACISPKLQFINWCVKSSFIFLFFWHTAYHLNDWQENITKTFSKIHSEDNQFKFLPISSCIRDRLWCLNKFKVLSPKGTPWSVFTSPSVY